MRAVAAALLVLSAAILLAALRVAARLPRPSDPDDPTINAFLTLCGFGLGVVGVALTLREFVRPAAPPAG